MKLRNRETGEECTSYRFNVYGLREIIVHYPTELDSDFICNYEVWLTKSMEWKDMREAFRDGDLIVNDENTKFFEPENDDEREKGYRA